MHFLQDNIGQSIITIFLLHNKIKNSLTLWKQIEIFTLVFVMTNENNPICTYNVNVKLKIQWILLVGSIQTFAFFCNACINAGIIFIYVSRPLIFTWVFLMYITLRPLPLLPKWRVGNIQERTWILRVLRGDSIISETWPPSKGKKCETLYFLSFSCLIQKSYL